MDYHKREKDLFEKGYYVDRMGNLYNPNGKRIIGSINSQGRRTTGVRDSRKCVTTISFHRMVAYAKYGDRHSVGYYEKYDNKHPERKLRRALYSMEVHNAYDAEELDARMALVTDEEFRRYVYDGFDIGDIPRCNVDLATMYENYLGVD